MWVWGFVLHFYNDEVSWKRYASLTEITWTGYSTIKSSNRSIVLCVLQCTFHELFCVFGVFYASGMQDAVTKSLYCSNNAIVGYLSELNPRLCHCAIIREQLRSFVPSLLPWITDLVRNSFSEPHTFAFWWCPIQGPCLKKNAVTFLFFGMSHAMIVR